MKKRIIALLLSAMMVGNSVSAFAAQQDEDYINIVSVDDMNTTVEASEDADVEDSLNTNEPESLEIVDNTDNLERLETSDNTREDIYTDEWLAERGLSRNAEGMIEFTDKYGEVWSYDPEDPEFYKYFGDEEKEYIGLNEDFDGNLSSFNALNETYSDPFTCPLTGRSYSYPKYYKVSSDKDRVPVRYGVDVSKYQGTISEKNWKSMKEDYGVDFAFIRAGFRGYGSSGSLNADATFAGNVQNAYNAGVKVGVYFFSQAISEKEAQDEADYCLSLIGNKKGLVTLPIVIDYEYAGSPGRLGGADLSADQHTDIVNAFCKRIRERGYLAGIYANKSMFNSDMVFSKIDAANYIWIAHWPGASGGVYSTDFDKRLESWQFTDAFTGFGTGGTGYMINDRVDLDFWFGVFPGEIVSKEITLSFDANGGSTDGSGIDDIRRETGETAEIPDCIYERKLCSFREWNSEPDGSGNSYLPGVDYVFGDADETLYAIWECTVTFDAGNGEAPDVTTVLADSLLAEPAAPEKEDYFFTGWYRDSACSLLWKFGSDKVVRSITLYAGWEKVEEEVNYELRVEGAVSEFSFTGSAITLPDLRVFYGNDELEAGKDYTIKYKNNTKAGVATYTVKGKGNFSGSYTGSFTILPLNFEDRVEAKDIAVSYTGKVQKGTTTVIYRKDNGCFVTLKAGTDFTYRYSGTDKKAEDFDSTAFVGDKFSNTVYTVEIIGKGNYKGTCTFNQTILSVETESLPVSKLSIKKIQSQTLSYDEAGNIIPATPKPLVYLKGNLVDEDDYDLKYINNSEPGTATVFVVGKGRFTGSRKVDFKVNSISMSKVNVSGLESGMTYCNAEIIQSGYELSYNGNALVEGRDFDVVYANNINAGKNKASISFKGKGIYSGTLKKTYTIASVSLAVSGAQNSDIAVFMNHNVPYAKGGAKPDVEIIYTKDGPGYTLTEGVDYTIKCSNNNAVSTGAGKKPTVIITGKGNFKGKLSASYMIRKANIGETTMTASDVVFKDKGYNCKSAITLTDSKSGKKLSAGSDYDKNVVYTYVDDGEEKEVGKTTVIPAGSLVKATVSGKGNYYGTNTTTFRVVTADISKATVKVADKTFIGRPVTLTKDDFTEIRVGSTYLGKEDFEIVPGSYVNNQKSGTAKVTIRGVGNYGGTKVVSFKIRKKGIS